MYTADPKTYSEVSKPHESVEAAEKAAQEFMREVRELRKKYRIPEVAFAISLNALDKEGVTIPLLMTSSHGDVFQAEALFAQGLGSARSDRKAIIGKMISSGD